MIRVKLMHLFTSLFPESYWQTAGQDGVRLYNVNFTPWEDITSATLTRKYGIQHILLKFKKRTPPFFFKRWWLPTYSPNFEQFENQVLRFAPKESPLRLLLESKPLLEKKPLMPMWMMVLACLFVFNLVDAILSLRRTLFGF